MIHAFSQTREGGWLKVYDPPFPATVADGIPFPTIDAMVDRVEVQCIVEYEQWFSADHGGLLRTWKLSTNYIARVRVHHGRETELRWSGREWVDPFSSFAEGTFITSLADMKAGR